MRLKKTYSSREVAALTGITARQLQLWDAGGLLTPTVRPHRTAAGGFTERRYTPIELFELIVLADLRRRGFLNPPAPHDPAHSEGAIRSAALRCHRRRRIHTTPDRRLRDLRAHRQRCVLQSAPDARAADAGAGERRGAQGVEWKAEKTETEGHGGHEGTKTLSAGCSRASQRIGNTRSRSSAGRGMT